MKATSFLVGEVIEEIRESKYICGTWEPETLPVLEIVKWNVMMEFMLKVVKESVGCEEEDATVVLKPVMENVV